MRDFYPDLPNVEEELALCRAELKKAGEQIRELKEINSSLAKVNIALREQLAPKKSTPLATLIERSHRDNVYCDGSPPPKEFVNFIETLRNNSCSGTPNIPGYKLPYETDD